MFKRLTTSVASALLALVVMCGAVGAAHAETRTLKLYFTHTKESAKITFKRNGRYDKRGLKKINRFLRDWRKKESTKMDPAVIDLLWEVYKKSGSRKPIHIISAYRSPKTNNMLRRRGRKVARNSQHTRGKAIDFFMPDVPVTKLRALGLQAHRGGVGYYRGSFVHLDTGRVRHWPRMSSRQLKKVFPRGKTIHVPSNGRKLRGYDTAMANLKKGRNADGSRRGSSVKGSLLARLFSRSGNDGDEDEGADTAPTPTAKPAPKKQPAPVKKKPEPAPVLVAKVEPKPAPKKPSGPSIFELEAAAADKKAAAAKAAAAADQALANKLAAEAELALQDAEAARKAAEDATPRRLAALTRVATPVRRPGAEIPAPAALTALAPVDAETAGARATEYALAVPDASPVPRPAADIPNVASDGPKPVAPAIAQTVAPKPAVAAPIRTAVLAPAAPLVRSTPAAPVDNTVPSADLAALTSQVAETFDSNSARRAQIAEAARFAKNAVLPTKRPAAIEQPQLVASLAPVESVTPRLNDAIVPVSRPNVKPGAIIEPTAVPVPKPVSASAGPTGYDVRLSLGNLDSRNIKTWAVAGSTRTGKHAKLRAPIYKRSTMQVTPSRVFSAGFGADRAPLRADSFTGRAVTRAHFARLAALN